jgi:hypothetical protein
MGEKPAKKINTAPSRQLPRARVIRFGRESAAEAEEERVADMV